MTTGVVIHFNGGEYQDNSGYFLIFGIPLSDTQCVPSCCMERGNIAFNPEPCPRM